jgi:hypothetical protein
MAGGNGTILKTTNCGGLVSTWKNEIIIPANFNLYQNYPNPFNPVTKIKFSIPASVKSERSNVKLIIYDILGREISSLVNDNLKPGEYEASWNAGDYSSGIYFYKLYAGNYSETKRMILLK